MRRIVGIDVARGIAVLGMMTAHVGPDDHGPVPPGGFSQLADGRPSALFVVLAGVSLALLSGGASPVTGPAMTQARVRVVVRAVLVLVLGVFLIALGTPVVVILPTYAVLFVAGAFVLGWSRRALLLASVALAVLGPPLVLWIVDAPVQQNTPLGLFVGPHYPALSWMSYLLTGLAVGRSDLRSPRLRQAGVLVGLGLVLLGHGGSWLVERLVDWPAGLTSSAPHASSTFELLGNTGVAFLVLVASLAAAERWPRAVSPVAAVGSLALTAYSVHIVAIAILGDAVVFQPTVAGWLAFLGVTLAACWAWARFLGRGPLERVMHEVSSRAARPPVRSRTS